MTGTGPVAVDPEEYNEWDRTGKVPVKKKVKRKSKPRKKKTVDTTPKLVEHQIFLKDIVLGDIVRVSAGERENVRDNDGMVTIGYNVTFTDKKGKTLNGWLIEGEYLQFIRVLSRGGNANTDGIAF